MARPRSETKKAAILYAALLEFAEAGLGASTASIAKRAGVAAGTLFTYFSTKEDLQNALYLDLKAEVYACMNDGFPNGSSLQDRLRHIWRASLLWAGHLPAKRKVSVQLHHTDLLSSATRKKANAMSGPVAQALIELEAVGVARGLPAGFATAAMSSLQDAALTLLGSASKAKRAMLMEQTFDVFWKVVQ